MKAKILVALLSTLAIAVLIEETGCDSELAIRPCRSLFEKVHTGMTKEEASAAVGGPPGNYTSNNLIIVPIRFGDSMSYHDSWLTNDCELLVLFNEKSVAVKVSIYAVEVAKKKR